MKKFRFTTIALILVILLNSFFTFTGCKNNDGDKTLILGLNSFEGLVVGVNESADNIVLRIDGQEINANLSVKNGKVIVPTSAFKDTGLKKVEIDMQNSGKSIKTYALDVEVVDFAIGTTREFSNWYNALEDLLDKNITVVFTDDIYVIGAAIDNSMSHYNWGGSNGKGFNGTIDGRGHVIYGFKSTHGFIPCVAQDGVIKNLAMVDMVTEGSWGFLGAFMIGTIENCYFQGVQTNSTKANWFTGFYGRYSLDNGQKVAKISNVVINVKRPTIGQENDAFTDNAYRSPKGADISGVYMINDNYNGEYFNGDRWDGLDVKIYSSVEDMASAVKKLPNGFSADYWKIDADGLLVMKNVE